MARLEELTRGASVKGILPDGLLTVVDVTWYGTEAVELTYKDAAGRLGHELLYREREATIELAAASRPWGFDGDGARFRLASEAYRIRLAYLYRSAPGRPQFPRRATAPSDHRSLWRDAHAPAPALPAR